MQVFLSVGGGGYPSSQFSQLAGTKALRTTFVQSVVSMLRKQQLHGLDIDWWVNRHGPRLKLLCLAVQRFFWNQFLPTKMLHCPRYHIKSSVIADIDTYIRPPSLESTVSPRTLSPSRSRPPIPDQSCGCRVNCLWTCRNCAHNFSNIQHIIFCEFADNFDFCFSLYIKFTLITCWQELSHSMSSLLLQKKGYYSQGSTWNWWWTPCR